VALDEDIKKAVQYALTINDSLSGQDIEVQVSSGVVVLSGTVQTQERKAAAHKVAESFDCVREIKNEIEVCTADDLADEDVAAQIRTALDAQTVVCGERITVSVENGTATLTGSVRSFWERTIVEDIAMSANGIHGVQNHLGIELAGIKEQHLSPGNPAEQ
jgi:osmotically-inducible protein OsmY